MKMNKRLISVVSLGAALAILGPLTASAINGIDRERDSGQPNSSGTIAPGLPTYDQWLADVGVGTQVSPGLPTYEEWLADVGSRPNTTNPIAVGEYLPNMTGEGKIEPMFADGEPPYLVTVDIDCDHEKTASVIHVTQDGEVGCDLMVPTDLDAVDTKEYPPVVKPEPPPVTG